VLGVALGAAASATGSQALAAAVRAVEPLGALWVNAIRMTIVPLVVSLLVTSVAGVADVRSVGRLGARAVGLFLALLTGSALVAALAGPPLFEHLPLDPTAAVALRERAAAAVRAGGVRAGSRAAPGGEGGDPTRRRGSWHRECRVHEPAVLAREAFWVG